MVGHLILTQKIAGSIPTASTKLSDYLFLTNQTPPAIHGITKQFWEIDICPAIHAPMKVLLVP